MNFLRVTDLIDIMFCGDDDLPSKPAPDSCQYICAQLGIDPRDAVMVGDTVNDLRMGNAAGIGLCIGVANGSSPADALLSHSHFVIESVEKLPNIFVVWDPK
eukprot:c8856_g1_i1.p3 GENE.c8856_g1_i1~~c8856_g1_i1.p3  ORF type:complete len:102 (+),score=20.79 c8856_g1_i1:580-885(+)